MQLCYDIMNLHLNWPFKASISNAFFFVVVVSFCFSPTKKLFLLFVCLFLIFNKDKEIPIRGPEQKAGLSWDDKTVTLVLCQRTSHLGLSQYYW